MNRKRLAIGFILSVCVVAMANAQDKPLVREIFVPFEDLNVILEADAHRVFLGRQEYEELLAKAKTKAAETVPLPATFLSGQYEATLGEGRAIVRGKLELELLQDELTALPLELGGVGVRSATLDGKPAALGRNAAGGVQLFVSGKGKHGLELELTAPLTTAAAQQTLTLRLPTPPAAGLKLTAPGNVEIKGGAEVASREYDMEDNQTRFELLLRPGDHTIVMSLNNRQVQDQRVLVARSVLVDEVTQGYERLHASISCRVLQGAADKLQFTLPKDFEVTSIVSTALSRWEIEPGDEKQTINIALREATSETIVLELLASRAPVLTEWKFPQLDVVDAAGHVAVLGLLVEDRLQPQQIAATGLLPLDAVALAQALPLSVTNPEKGAPGVRQVVTYYAPSNDYALSANFVKLPAELHLVSNSLLLIGERELSFRGGFALTPTAEKRFEFRFTAPAPWKVNEVTLPDGTPLPVERFGNGQGGERLVVKVPSGLPAGSATSVNYTAVATPPGWLGDWSSRSVAFPVFVVDEVTRAEGGLAVHVQDDMTARPDKLENLTPLLDNEKREYGFGELPTALAFRYDSLPYSATLLIERTSPSISAQAISMLRLESDHVAAHYELDFSIESARTQKLAFSLPANATPTEISVRAVQAAGLAPAVVKEFIGEEQHGRRHWRVTLADRVSGRVKLAVDFTRRYEQEQPKNLSLPLIRAEHVEYQTGLIAVEGSADLEVEIQKAPALRNVDVGELAAAEQAVGRRVVGTFGYVGSEPTVRVDVRRGAEHRLPVAIAQRAELITQVDAAGTSVTAARWLLHSNVGFLEIALPPDATLWTVRLDGQSTRPQEKTSSAENVQSVLLDLGAATGGVRDLQVVYLLPAERLGFAGKFELLAPSLFVHDEHETGRGEIASADLQWHLLLPTGYRVLKSEGTVFPDERLVTVRRNAAVKTLAIMYEVAGGVGLWKDREVFPRRKSDMTFASSPKSAVARPYAMTEESAAPQANPPAATTASPAIPPEAGERFDLAHDKSKSMRAADPFSDQPVDTKPATPSEPPAINGPADFAPPKPQDDLAAMLPGEGAKSSGGRPARQGNYWALEGIGTLPIAIAVDPHAQGQFFRSYGADPELNVTLVNGRRLLAAAWGVGLLAFLLGLQLTCRPVRHRLTYVLVLMLLGAAPPLFSSQLDPALPVFDAVFFAGAALVAWYLVAGALQAFLKRCPQCASWLPSCATRPIGAALLCLAALLVSPSVYGQSPAAKALAVGPPVKVPADAIIIPYDPEVEDGTSKAEKALVPYEKYVELWNLAFPEKKLRDPKLPTPFALAGAAWQGTLASNEQLTLQGVIEIDVFDDQPVQIPFPLTGGVLETATLDGKPARLQIVQPQAAPAQAQAALPGAQPLGDAMLVVHAQGQGRKKLTLMVRLPLTQQGGWRIVDAKIPSAPAASLAVTVPHPQTEVRVTGIADRAAYDTTEANEKLETVIAPDGALSLRWRPRVSEGQVDADLVAYSRAVLDVREDALRLTWQVKCDFRRGTRESFTFSVPSDYTVDQVAGANIKSWQAKPDGDRQTVEVTLLKAAAGSETFGIYLARRGKVGADELAQFAVPAVQVASAALHQGELLIRRSPRLELQTVGNPTLARIDVTNELLAIASETDRADPPAIPLQPYQAWRFQGTSYSLVLSAAAATQGATVEVRTLVAIGSRRSDLYANLRVRPRGLPVYRLRAYLPPGFQLRSVAPSELEWAVTDEDGRQLLTAHLPLGRGDAFEVILEGKLGKTPAPGTASPVPFFEFLDVAQQTNEVAITADPVDDVSFGELKNVEVLSVRDVFSWVQAVRQPLVKGAVRTRSTDAAATYKLTRRPTIVTVRTITNVKVTRQAVLETSLLSYRIEQGSLSELSFLLPERLKDARIEALLLRQKTIEPATTGNGQPRPGWVRVKLQLQDEVNGDYRVAINHDRLLPADKETIQPPIVERHPTAQQIVVLENAGRDEVQVDSAEYLEELDRQQSAWRELEQELGSHILRAWRAAGAGEPRLVFHTQARELAQTAKARIGWAELQMAVDQAGTYRAVQQYRVFNQTEQYLEVLLPGGARLWTTLVAGEPVKPVESNTPGIVRIPLVKTAEGDGDYLVELKYGGRMHALNSFTPLRVPVLKVQNLRVEQNHVRLFLPDSHQWFAFDGTLRQVTDSGNVAASFQDYLNKQILETRQKLSSDNLNTRLRAANNLKQLGLALQEQRGELSRNPALGAWKTAQEQAAQNYADLSALNRQIEAAPMVPQGLEGDNRDRLNDLFRAQSLQRAKGNATQFGNNFETRDFDYSGSQQQGQRFNAEWYEGNKLTAREDESRALRLPQTAAPDGKQLASGKKGDGQGKDNWDKQFQQGRFSRGGQTLGELRDSSATPQPTKPAASPGQAPAKLPQIANARDQKELVSELDKLQSEKQAGKGLQDRELENSARYQQRLEAQNPVNQAPQQQFRTDAYGMPADGRRMGGVGGGMLAGQTEGESATFARQPRPGLEGGYVPGQEAEEDELADLGGYRSLDVPLPARGKAYYFTTVGSDVTLTARGIKTSRLERLAGLGLIAFCLAALWLITRGQTLARLGAWLKTTPALLTLLLLSGVLFFLGILPVFTGLVGIALAAALVARAVVLRNARPATAA